MSAKVEFSRGILQKGLRYCSHTTKAVDIDDGRVAIDNNAADRAQETIGSSLALTPARRHWHVP